MICALSGQAFLGTIMANMVRSRLGDESLELLHIGADEASEQTWYDRILRSIHRFMGSIDPHRALTFHLLSAKTSPYKVATYASDGTRTMTTLKFALRRKGSSSAGL